ncbi:hypothetical protein GDO86_008141 [Hymenochirus boettgeri]|uniref:NEDD4-binding protein 1 n=1 Tax=Hymenochirus boettgeri TaxID=247094 RepID=A0A8T2J3R0_9PIPI|nr:hypothetical protein GDO86_008141 [Hymenochirus boettgeri]
MHCIFVGAQGLFLNQLIQDTCANVSVSEIGVLSIKGGIEPVVMAQSHVQQFVRLFKNNLSLPNDRESAVKKKFKLYVEKYADKYTVDLLLLPSALQSELLSLTCKDEYVEQGDIIEILDNRKESNEDTEHVSREKTRTPVTELTSQLESVFSGVEEDIICIKEISPVQQERLSSKRRISEVEESCSKKPFSLEAIQVDGPVCRNSDAKNVSIIDLLSGSSDLEDSVILVEGEDSVGAKTEYKILVNFFKTMGYSQVVVEKVIGEFGQYEEPLKLLEEIEKESKKEVGFLSINESNNGTDQLKARGTSSPPKCKIAIPETAQQQYAQPLNVNKKVSHHADKEQPSTSFNYTAKNIVTSNAPPVQDATITPLEGPCSYHSASPLTGVQIFQNSLKIPYRLELKNEPGKMDFKHIIIDGSNVAMSHGLKKFFSCRGIALAVDYFWTRGHRNITVFVPQWRTKRDPYITEQHFLQQLQELGILSFTPARTVLGARIASHDDRFLLHLAEKTGGIIVTNDNFREFVAESPVWREIIKERTVSSSCPSYKLMTNPRDHFSQPKTIISSFGQTRHFPLKIKEEVTALMQNIVWPSPIAPSQRSPAETTELRESLLKIFPGSEHREKINHMLIAHPYMRDLNALSAMLLD